MDLRKLYSPRYMNTFQVIALTGFIMTALAQIILHFIGKQIPNFEMLYPCWLVLFVFGLLRNIYAKPHDDHHHHH